MPIPVTCACGKRFDAPDHYAGRKGTCPDCGAELSVPPSSFGSSPAPAPAGGGLTPPPSGSGPAPVAIGRKLGGYELVRRLGAASSTVFLANSPKGQVALKVLPQQIIARSPTAGKRFVREARELFPLQHPSLARILDAGEELGTYYMALEHFEGRSLRDVMAERGGRLPEREALGIAEQVARGLGALHGRSLVHRNVRPDHILVDAAGAVKLVGLGLVRQESDDVGVTAKGAIVGTPQYMPPEQATTGEVDSRSDLYSLGITLYEMLAGEVPFDDKVLGRILQKVTRDPPPPLREKSPEVSEAAAAVVTKLLEKDPGDRYATSDALAADLLAVQQGKLVAGLPPGLARAAVASAPASDGSAPAGASEALVKKLIVLVGVLIAVVLVLVVAVVALALKG